MYFKLFKDSWSGLRKNLILLVPDLLLIFGFLIFSALFLILISNFPGFSKFSDITSAANMEQIKELILGFIKLNPLKILISALLFLAAVIFYGVTTNVWKFNMMKDVVNKKKADLRKAFKEIKEFYWKFIGINLIIILITFLISFFIIILAYFIRMPKFWDIVNSTVLVLMGLIFAYKEAILFLDKKSSINTIKSTFRFFLNKSNYVFLTWFITFIISIAFTLLFIFAANIKISSIALVLGIASFIVAVWVDLFFFYAYKLKKG